MTIDLYTDGAAKGNPGKGGYAAILVSGSHQKEIAEGFRLTTNNRMELWGVIAGLQAIKQIGHQINIYTDSKYVVDAVEKKWVFGWEKKQFTGKKNADLWQIFLNLYRLHQIRFFWIKGHQGHFFNEKCDQLACAAAQKQNLQIDTQYEILNSQL